MFVQTRLFLVGDISFVYMKRSIYNEELREKPWSPRLSTRPLGVPDNGMNLQDSKPFF